MLGAGLKYFPKEFCLFLILAPIVLSIAVFIMDSIVYDNFSEDGCRHIIPQYFSHILCKINTVTKVDSLITDIGVGLLSVIGAFFILLYAIALIPIEKISEKFSIYVIDLYEKDPCTRFIKITLAVFILLTFILALKITTPSLTLLLYYFIILMSLILITWQLKIIIGGLNLTYIPDLLHYNAIREIKRTSIKSNIDFGSMSTKLKNILDETCNLIDVSINKKDFHLLSRLLETKTNIASQYLNKVSQNIDIQENYELLIQLEDRINILISDLIVSFKKVIIKYEWDKEMHPIISTVYNNWLKIIYELIMSTNKIRIKYKQFGNSPCRFIDTCFEFNGAKKFSQYQEFKINNHILEKMITNVDFFNEVAFFKALKNLFLFTKKISLSDYPNQIIKITNLILINSDKNKALLKYFQSSFPGSNKNIFDVMIERIIATPKENELLFANIFKNIEWKNNETLSALSLNIWKSFCNDRNSFQTIHLRIHQKILDISNHFIKHINTDITLPDMNDTLSFCFIESMHQFLTDQDNNELEIIIKKFLNTSSVFDYELFTTYFSRWIYLDSKMRNLKINSVYKEHLEKMTSKMIAKHTDKKSFYLVDLAFTLFIGDYLLDYSTPKEKYTTIFDSENNKIMLSALLSTKINNNLSLINQLKTISNKIDIFLQLYNLDDYNSY